jgi:type III secretory pathway component EscS
VSPTVIYVVAVVVSLSKAITKLITFNTEMRERIFAVCVCVCVCVSWITDKSITNQNVVVLIYIAELNNKLCVISPSNFKTFNI